jgi:hypothetical protein
MYDLFSFSVDVYNFQDTATNGDDYTFASSVTRLTFRGGDSKLLPIYFNIIDDNNVENEENFNGLINADGNTVRTEEPLLVKVYIEDNDGEIFTESSRRLACFETHHLELLAIPNLHSQFTSVQMIPAIQT